jgi:hypothetical protein
MTTSDAPISAYCGTCHSTLMDLGARLFRDRHPLQSLHLNHAGRHHGHCADHDTNAHCAAARSAPAGFQTAVCVFLF